MGADRSCQVCTRLVCEKCGADWTTCPEPTGREIRLGRTARLRDVDPTGRIGLVTRWVGDMKLVDMRRLRWVSAEPPRHHKVHDSQILERLTPTGELYCNQYAPPGDDPIVFEALQRRALATSGQTTVNTNGLEPDHGAGMTTDGHYYFVSTTQLVVVVAPDTSVRAFEPLPKRVVQACHVDVEVGILASATWGEITLHRIAGEAIGFLSRVQLTGNARWVVFEEPYLAACIDRVVRVWRVGENFAIGRQVYEAEVTDSPTGTFSRDGRYLAFADGAKVILHDLEQEVSIAFEDHSDTICLVRFAGMDQLLITADEDNRVVLRPRTATGYVRTVIDVAIPDAPIELSLDELPGTVR